MSNVIDAKTREEIRKNVTDGFANFMSRLGVGDGVDNQLSDSHYQFNLLSRNRVQLEAAYRGSWIVGAMIDSIAEDMTKAGIDIVSSDAPEDIIELQSYISKMRIWTSLCDTKKWARLYGGAIGVIMIDGQDLSSPLRMDTIGKGQFSGVAVYDRWQVVPDLTTVIPSGPEVGLPAYYTLLTLATILSGEANQGTLTDSSGVRVHHSRIIRQIGVKLPFWQAITEQLWGMSELERIHDRLVSFDAATLSSANLINHAHLRTVQVEGLRDILSAGGKAEEAMIKMFEYMRLLQSNEGITLLDSKDTFNTTAYTFSGLSDMMLQFGQQLSGASGIPLVRLFGQSPAGLNSTGESDLRNYYDNINAQQESDFRPGVEKLLHVCYRSRFGRPAPSDMTFKFTSLWQMTPEQKANVAKTTTETITAAHESGAIKRSTMLKELKQLAIFTGLFSNISDEDVNEAEQDDDSLPMPELDPAAVEKLKATDSFFRKVFGKKKGKK